MANTLETYASPVIGTLPVQAIDLTFVMKVLEPIWHMKPETATRLRSRMESVAGSNTAEPRGRS